VLPQPNIFLVKSDFNVNMPTSKMLDINPLEGNPMIKFLCVVISLSLLGIWFTNGLVSILFWIIVIFLGFFLFSTLYLRLKNKWGHLHYPMMVRYANAAGLTVGAKKKGVDLGNTIDSATTIIVRSVFPGVSDKELKKILDEIAELKHNLYGKQYLTKLLKKYSGLGEKEAKKIARELSKTLAKRKERLSPTFTIAYLIEQKYGKDEQMKYFHAVLTNKAK